ncbi:MAG: lytic transglycosylase domain-containing protein [Rhodobacteraceae bacterium]|nr:MAG: lytic transglycosylase domain-containing protein [Paracoccaceae bacterium]
MTERAGKSRRGWILQSCLISVGMIIPMILAWPILARAANPAQLCETAAQTAAQRHNVPLDIMRTVALVETGRTRNGRLEPWPWAINTGGPGHWPDSRAAALDLVRARLAQGRQNVDLGCFQVNYRWHGQNFRSLDDMIDPQVNADYAARLLRDHKARLGSWEAAVGAYHSGTPDLARRYIARFRALRGRSDTPVMTAAAPVASPQSARENRFSLLQPHGEQRLGSLVPTGGSSRAATALIPLASVAR